MSSFWRYSVVLFSGMIFSAPAYARISPIQSLTAEEAAAQAIQAATSQLDPSLGNAITMAIGIGMDHRPLEPATPLGLFPGLEMSLSLVLAKPNPSLGTAFSSSIANLTGSSSTYDFSAISQAVIPSLRFQIHKGLGSWGDLGIAIFPPIKYIPLVGGSRFYAADLKVCLLNPQEGPTISARLSYNLNVFDFQNINLTTVTWTPAILISRKIGFADPYLGVSFQYTTGTLNLTLDSSSLLPEYAAGLSGIPTVTLTQGGKAIAANLFGGVSLKVPVIGLRLTLEGAYNTANMPYLGAKAGLSF